MPNPTIGTVHVDQALTNVSIGYFQTKAEKFVCDRAFPLCPVDKQSNKYHIFDKSDLARIEAKIRADGAESAEGGYRLSNTSYFADVYGLHFDITDRMRANADPAVDQDISATEYLTMQMLLKRDKVFATNAFASSKWTTDWTATSGGTPGTSTPLQWDQTNSHPVVDIRFLCDSIEDLHGFRPNKMVIGRKPYSKLLDHADITDRVKYTARADTAEISKALADIFELDEIIVGGAVENTAAEKATASMARLFGKHVLLLYVADAPAIATPSAGYNFSWSEFDLVRNGGAAIRKFRMDWMLKDRVESEMAFTPTITGADLGGFVANIIG